MNSEEVRQIVHEEVERAVRDGVKDALTTLGVDAGDPFAIQRDMQFIRTWRTSTETLRSRGLMILLGILVAGVAGALWAGIKIAVTK